MKGRYTGFAWARLLQVSLVLLCAALMASSLHGVRYTNIATLAKSEPTIYVAGGDDPLISQAVADLERILELRTGIDWALKDASSQLQASGFYIGNTALRYTKPALPQSQWRDVMAMDVSQEQILLYGDSNRATAFAIWSFIEEYLNVYWIMPGDLGESIGADWEGKIPRGKTLFRSSFKQRLVQIGNGSGREVQLWANRNRLHLDVKFNHNFSRIFTKKVLEKHPPLLPWYREQRATPDCCGSLGLQPNLLGEGAVEIAADAARAYFEKNPQAQSFSLAPNDSLEWSQDLRTRRAIQPKTYFRRMANYSPLNFAFANAVIDALGEDYADKYFGNLAYFTTLRAPAFPVNKRIIPFLATDWFQYYDKDYEAGDVFLMEEWSKSGVEYTGLFDYLYGSFYRVPRLVFSNHAKALKFAHEHKAAFYFGHATPHWGMDAPKIWQAVRLTKNIDGDPYDILKEFCQRFYGDAAEPMEQFYLQCERIWNAQPLPGNWLKGGSDFAHVGIFSSEQMAALTELLNDAQSKATDALSKERITMTQADITVASLFVQYYECWYELSSLTLNDAAQVQYALQELPALFAMRKELREAIQAEVGKNKRHQEYYADHGTRYDPAYRIIERANALKLPIPEGLEEVPADDINRPSTPNLLQAPVFEAPDLIANPHPIPASMLNRKASDGVWQWEANDTEGAYIHRVQEDGRWSLLQAGITGGYLHQWVPAQPNTLYRVAVELKGYVPFLNRVEMRVAASNQDGSNMEIIDYDRLPSGIHDNWVTLVVYARMPANAAFLYFELQNRGQTPPGKIWISRPIVQRVD